MTPTRRITQRDMANTLTPWEGRRLVEGEDQQKKGDFIGAMKSYVKILTKNPKCWPAVFNAAVLAHTICEHDWAIHHLNRAVRALPGFCEAWYNLGTMQQCVGQYAESAHALRQAIALDPTMVGARINLGNALLGLGQLDEAHAAYNEALAYKPQNPEAIYNLAHYYLLTGQWREGWRCYEARWHLAGFQELNAISVDVTRPGMPRPWPEGVDIRDKTLIVAEEQGYGDLFMTLRYAPTLRDLGATVIWAVRPECTRLVERTVAPDRVVSIREPMVEADFVVSCMTLHQRLGTAVETVPGADGYLMRAA